MTNNYYSVAQSGATYQDGLKSAKDQGYTHLYRWINSDLGWTFFTSSLEEACKESALLYLTERGVKRSPDMTFSDAEKYYPEFVDVIDIDEELDNL